MFQKMFFALLFVCSSANLAIAQKYFQQEVDYKIVVSLDDKTHTLRGNIEMVYHNNSPDELDTIYMHLWPNAYATRQTHYAKQEVRNGSTKFQFAKKSDLGRIDSLNWTIDGVSVVAEPYQNEPDMVVIKLPKRLRLGGSITIATPMRVDIPETFSRLGHVGESYQMTQWYPKPAVYDVWGWHPIPYLDQGEFFSEFGSFDVTISLPQNYVVGATGTLETASEVAWLRDKVKESESLLEAATGSKTDFPKSSAEMKTIRYTAKKVHDFAWFADKRFYVQHQDVRLSSGRKVDAWAMFTDTDRELWRDSGVHYVARGLLKYSEVVGEYPYPHATAVQSALSAGAGMEYPMITVIGSSRSAKVLDEVIIHEVGHNWFYGILASNERDFAWMDEGFNTYVENRYMAAFYPNEPNTMGLPAKIFHGRGINFAQLSYRFLAERGNDVAPSTNSELMDGANYGLMSYYKTELMLRWLELYVGTDTFDLAMHQYYDTWKFKHPYPEDVRSVFERVTKRDLSWFFDDQFARSGYVNYQITEVRKDGDTYSVTIVSDGNATAPMPICAVKAGKTIKTVWSAAGDLKQIVAIPFGDYDEIVIDNDHLTTDMWDSDNRYKLKGARPTFEPMRLQFLGLIDRPERTTVYYAPFVIANCGDGFGIGLALYNSLIPQKKMDWLIAPAYAFGSRKVVGKASCDLHLIARESKWAKEVTVSGEYQRSNVGWVGTAYLPLRQKFTISAALHFRHKPASNLASDITFRNRILSQTVYKPFNRVNPNIASLRYNRISNHKLHPYSFWLEMEHASVPPPLAFTSPSFPPPSSSPFTKKKNTLELQRVSAAYKQKITINKHIALSLRVYASHAFQNERTLVTPLLSESVVTDYKFDQYYFDRARLTNNFWSRQISPNTGGGMKLNSFAAAVLSGNRNTVFTFSSDIRLYKNLPIKPYFDYGYVLHATRPSVWSTGIALDLDIFAVYFPLASSSNVWVFEKYANSITFSLDVRRLQKAKFGKLLTNMM